MGINFLPKHGALRMRNYEPQSFLLDDGMMAMEDELERVSHDVEMAPDQWCPIDVKQDLPTSEWPLRPQRFIDGKDVGRTVAWLRSREGYPVPVYLSQIGAVEMRLVGGSLRRDFHVIERVVTLMVDLFPWDEIEYFADALQQNGFRLLSSKAPAPIKEGKKQRAYSFDFERMRKTTQNRSNEEMGRLEKQTLARACQIPTLVDGRLEPRASAFNDGEHFVVGLVKTHNQNFLHPRGWNIFYDLQPGQRTPAFHIRNRELEVISWYLRLDGANGEMPNWGVVRLEIPANFYFRRLREDTVQLNRLSQLICEYRCRDANYGRAPVSIYPIQRAEETLGAVLVPTETFINRFYRLNNL